MVAFTQSSLTSNVYPKQPILDTYIISDAFFRQPTAQHFNNLTEQLSIIAMSLGAVYNRGRNPTRNTILYLMRLTEKLLGFVENSEVFNVSPDIEDAIRRALVKLDPHVSLIPCNVYLKARKGVIGITNEYNEPSKKTVLH